MTETRLHIDPSTGSGPLVARLTVGNGSPTVLWFGSGRHPDEPVHISIPSSERMIRSRVGGLVVATDGLGIGRSVEAMDHQLTIRRPDSDITETLTAAPGSRSFPEQLVERKFLDDDLTIEIDFPPHSFSFRVCVVNPPWVAHRATLSMKRRYEPTSDPQVRLLSQAIVEPTLRRQPPRLEVRQLAATLGWSERKVTLVGARAHRYFLGHPAPGDRHRLARLSAFLIERRVVTATDLDRDLVPHQEELAKRRLGRG